MKIIWRWLGLAGIELSTRGQVLVIDPCLSRFPLYRMWLGRLETGGAIRR